MNSNSRRTVLTTLALLTGVGLYACGSDNTSGGSNIPDGSTSAGGESAAASGGAGAVASGGSRSTGGASTGSGGKAGGGSGGAGAGTGGAGTGGVGAGGTGAGGAGTGGAGTGGAGTGGVGTGGAGTGGAGTGGTGTGGAGTGGTGTGGSGTGGAGTGGTGTGGAGTGGTGTGGSGTGGADAGGGPIYCHAPHPVQVADTAACLGCESDNCTADVDLGCDNITDPAKHQLCVNVLSCIRTTDCIEGGDVHCYCGTADIASCKATPGSDGSNPANGDCKAAITAAYGSNDPANIVNNIGVVTLPHGAALALGRCDYKFCGTLDGYNSECVPYCGN